MTIKQIFVVLLVSIYLYTLTFDLFLNNYFRFPTPLLLGIPLILIYKDESSTIYKYWKEIVLFFIAIFIYDVVGAGNYKSFTVDFITILVCSLYFNFFVAANRQRLKLSILIYYFFLAFSTIVMLLNHIIGDSMIPIRGMLIGGTVVQSPSGITPFIFSFGYQLAPLATFLLIYSIVFNRAVVLKIAFIIFGFLGIYFGLQRSVFVTFIVSSFLFFIFYYRMKSLFVIALILTVGFVSFNFLENSEWGGYDNILTKNESKSDENREGLMTENLKIIVDYPFGLLLHGKSWKDVTRDNPVFPDGLTSHNAYLMFITVLGPIIGMLLLYLIYIKIYKIFKYMVHNIYSNSNRLLVCLCFSFLAVSINSMFHNAWLLGSNGPTIFLYFAILQIGNEPALSEQVD